MTRTAKTREFNPQVSAKRPSVEIGTSTWGCDWDILTVGDSRECGNNNRNMIVE